jgi:hypothetical protein
MSEQESPQPDRQPERQSERDPRTGRFAAEQRIKHQTQWVELQLQRAMERGDFDNLPGYGRPIDGLGTEHDPDWWLKKLVEREKVSVLPPSLQIRKDDLELDGVLDEQPTETEVRREVEDFNDRVRRARIQPLGGPPMITPERDVEAEVEAWRVRREERRAAQRAAARRQAEEKRSEPRRRWWQHGAR